MLFKNIGENVQDYRVPVATDRLQALKNIASQDPVHIDEFLPTSTMDLCATYLEEYEARQQEAPLMTEMPFFGEFIFLRDRLREHVQQQRSPSIGLLHPPIGATTLFKEQFVAATGISVEEADASLRANGFDPLAADGDGADDVD